MFKIIKFYIHTIIKYNQSGFILYSINSAVASIISLLGIFSIFPLIALISKPNLLLNNDFFKNNYILEFTSTNQLLIQISIFFLIFNFLGLLIIFINNIFGFYLAKDIKNKITQEMYKKLINSTYKLGIAGDSRSNNLNFFNSEVQKIQDSIANVIDAFQRILILIIFLFGIILFEKKALLIVLVIFILYLIIYSLTKKKLVNFSLVSSSITKKLNQINLYINLGLKDILIFKLGDSLVKNLKILQRKLLFIDLKTRFIIQTPKFVFEILIYIFFVFFIIYMYRDDKIINDLPSLSLFAFLIYKSIPIFFGLYSIVSNLQKNTSAYNYFTNMLRETKFNNRYLFIKKFNNKIQLKDLEFEYNNNKSFKFNLDIKKGDKLLITGKSGVGKSTLLNILTGLLNPNKGSYKIDNKELIKKNYKTSIFGYVAQNVILFPGRLVDNITIGKKGNIKDRSIKKIKKIYDICGLENLASNFEEFLNKKIEFDSPELSGGQKQRINIARTLYTEPQIIILDEATNALDKKSEELLFKNIFKNYKKTTIIVVSHRPNKKFFTKNIYLK